MRHSTITCMPKQSVHIHRIFSILIGKEQKIESYVVIICPIKWIMTNHHRIGLKKYITEIVN